MALLWIPDLLNRRGYGCDAQYVRKTGELARTGAKEILEKKDAVIKVDLLLFEFKFVAHDRFDDRLEYFLRHALQNVRIHFAQHAGHEFIHVRRRDW